ncbi:MAG: hypothetical protein ACLTSZ_03545 [Lachnospiraceae bacterium]
MGFLPKGSIPYQQYINDETPSLAGYLRRRSATVQRRFIRTIVPAAGSGYGS